MQPDAILPLFEPLTSLRGVGPAVATLIARAAGGARVLDLLFHLPESFIDRRLRPTLREAHPGETVTLTLEILRHDKPSTPRQPWRVVGTDGTGTIELVFFQPSRLKLLPVGARLLVSGKLDSFNDRLTMPHPDHIVPTDEPERLPAIEPVWPLTAGLYPSQIRAALARAFAVLPDFPEWHDPSLLRRERWPSFRAALAALHMPSTLPDERPRARLAYDELLAHQLAMAWLRNRERHRPGYRPHQNAA